MLDASVTLAWGFEDEANEYSDSVLEALKEKEALLPALWTLEVANVLAVGEGRGRLSPAESSRFAALLTHLPIRVAHGREAMDEILALARETGVSAYDASYLALAVERNLPLATRDRALGEAATAYGGSAFETGSA